MRYKSYKEGLNMKQFKRVDGISCYNRNYYIGIKEFDLLYAWSDDDNTTNWYIIDAPEMIYLGYSFTSEGDKLIRSETQPT